MAQVRMLIMKCFGRGFYHGFFLLALVALAGCTTATSTTTTSAKDGKGKSAAALEVSGTLIHVGDILTIGFPDTTVPSVDDVVKEDGSITLIYNQKFQASGKTVGELQTEIRNRYVPDYFKYLSVSIKLQDRYFSVGGEVRAPNRQLYTGYMTVLRAIDTAGGFTDFANKHKVYVTRVNGKKIRVDCKHAQDHPDQDVEIFPGDKVFVTKKWF